MTANPAPILPVWVHLLGVLAAELTLTISVAAILTRLTKAAVWQRAIWQACLVALIALTSFELSGAGRQVAGWVARKTRPAPTASIRSQPAESAQPVAAHSVQVTDEFRNQVAKRVAQNRKTSIQPEPAQPINQRYAIVRANSQTTSVTTSPRWFDAGTDALAVLRLGLVWVAGAALVLARICLSRLLLLVFRWRRRVVADPTLNQEVRGLAIQLRYGRRVRLVESERLTGPVAFGILRPTIGVPRHFTTRFSRAQQQTMLAHELAHLAAHDPFWHLMADLTTVILWWHPLVWWARRQSHAASENAADEASLLVAGGPGVLAECLVELGAPLAGRRPAIWLRIEGSGFRSGLGRRVERLVNLRGRSWTAPNRVHSVVARTLGSASVVAAAIMCTAWTGPLEFTKGNFMQTMNQTWKQSLAALALLVSVEKSDGADSKPRGLTPPATAATQPDQKTTAGADSAERQMLKIYKLKYTQPTNLLAIVTPTLSEGGKAVPDERSHSLIVFAKESELPEMDSLIAKLDKKPAAGLAADNTAEDPPPAPAVEPPTASAPRRRAGESRDSRTSPFYQRMMMERYGLIPKGAPLPASIVPGGADLSAVESRLEQIVFDHVEFDAIPLSEVLKYLDDESRRRDPAKRGINFLINPNVVAAPVAPTIDPNTGQEFVMPSPAPPDMNSVLIRFNLPLREVRLKDVLNAIVRVADHPIQYAVEEFGVVFSQKTDAAVPSSPGLTQPAGPAPLEIRTFKVDTNSFVAGLKSTFGVGTDALASGSGEKIREVLGEVFAKLGINMDVAGKAVFYNSLTGIIMVRGTREDLEIVQAAIETLGGSGQSSAANADGAGNPGSAREMMMRRYGLRTSRQ